MEWLVVVGVLALAAQFYRREIYHFLVNVRLCDRCRVPTTDWSVERSLVGHAPVVLCRRCRKEYFRE